MSGMERLSLSEFVKRAREGSGLSRAKLAKKAHLARMTVYRIENGQSAQLGTLVALSKALKVDVSSLLCAAAPARSRRRARHV
jgi:transcriptional regulator with XRE-family HTH domain